MEKKYLISESEFRYIVSEAVVEALEAVPQYLLFEAYLSEVASLKDVHEKYYSGMSYDDFDIIVHMDPTSGPDKMGKYSKWLLTMSQKGAFTPQNFLKVKQYLEFYNKFISRIEKKDINQIKSVEELKSIVKPFMDNPNQPVSKAQATREIKLNEAIKVYEDNVWLVIVPLSPESAIQYGKHTKWCTASTDKSSNMFFRYNSKGNLYIFINKQNGRKYQMSVHDGEIKDERDEDVDELEGATPGVEQFIDRLPEMESKIMQKKLNFYNARYENLLKRGKSPEEIFSFVSVDFHEGFKLVRNDFDKYNFLSESNQILSPIWFDGADYFDKGVARVELNNLENFLRKDGRSFLLKDWVYTVGKFKNGFSMITSKLGFNFVNIKGELLFPDWKYDAREFEYGVAYVKDTKDSAMYPVDKTGRRVSDEGDGNRIDEIKIKKMVAEILKYALREDVYSDLTKVDNKKKTIGLTYNAGKPTYGTQANPFEKLKTDKMDQDNASTYEVMLKGGVVSYNITDIKGNEIMHYFKRLWDNQETKIAVKVNGSTETDDYTLKMLAEDEKRFMARFKRKIEIVVSDWCDKHRKPSEDFRAISIYPVPSSSKFNSKMAELLSSMNIHGLPVQVINQSLLVKDLRNLEKDSDFIDKNKEHYDSNIFKDGTPGGTFGQHIDKTVNKFQSLNEVWKLLPKINGDCKSLLQGYYYSNHKGGASDKLAMKMAEIWMDYYDNIQRCYGAKYISPVDNKEHTLQHKMVIVAKKYTKGPSVDTRSKAIAKMVEPYVRGKISPVTGKPYQLSGDEIEVCEWDKASFEIKKMSNSERMGLKNIFNPNQDSDLVQSEVERIKGTIFVIFDDNLSGGATLSDICYQCKQLGIENIIPITFGKMAEKITLRMKPLTLPINNKGERGYNY